MIRSAVDNIQTFKKGAALPANARFETWGGVVPKMGAYLAKRNTPAPVAPASAPASPAPTLPTDSLYDTTVNRIGTNLTTGEAALTNEENALGTQTGVAFDRNPDGSLANFRLD